MDKKDIQRIILISVINYFLVLTVSLLISFFLPGLFSIVWITMTVLSIYLLISYWYFPVKPKYPLKEGFIVGLLVALITFVIELLLWYSTYGIIYFLNFVVFLQYFLTIIIPIFAAFLKQDNKMPVKKQETNWKDRL